MSSPPALQLQGASRTTGAIFRGRALGNTVDHADFSDQSTEDIFSTIKPIYTFKILPHLELGEAILENPAPDFVVRLPSTVFVLTGTSLRAEPLLKKVAQLYEKVLSKYCE
jgi:hypothetical protein